MDDAHVNMRSEPTATTGDAESADKTGAGNLPRDGTNINLSEFIFEISFLNIKVIV